MAPFLEVAAAQASVADAVETSVMLTVFDTIREHPFGTFMVIIGLIALLAFVTVAVLRRVKSEARGYYTAGRSSWQNVRNRWGRQAPEIEPSLEDQVPGDRSVPPVGHPDDSRKAG